jgi:SET domain-containing protein
MIEVGVSSIHGRGAFAAVDIAKGTAFHVAHLMVFGCEEAEAVTATSIGAYVFYIEDCPNGGTHDHVGLAMSPISFINHRLPPNAAFTVNSAALTVTFTALADIAAGEELTIDYGDFAEKLGIAG